MQLLSVPLNAAHLLSVHHLAVLFLYVYILTAYLVAPSVFFQSYCLKLSLQIYVWLQVYT